MPNTPTRARGAGREAEGPGRAAGSLTVIDSEVEVVDVLRVEAGGRAEDDLAVGADRVLAEPAGLELLALLAGDAAGLERRGSLTRQVADVLRHPELELLDGAVLDELAHLVREPEPGQLDLALLRRGRQVPRG